MAARGTDLLAAGPADLESWAATKPRTHSTQVQLRSALGHFYALCGRHDAPLWAIRPPHKPPMRCRAVEDATARALDAAARARRDRKGLAVLLGLYAGLRREEIANLRWDDIDEGWVRVTGKGDRTRYLPLHPAILQALAEVPVSGPAVFPGQRGRTSVNPATVWEWVREVSERAGMPVRTHQLRHTCLAKANDETGDLRAVQELAGHARPETTAGYTRVQRKRLATVVASIDYGAGSE